MIIKNLNEVVALSTMSMLIITKLNGAEKHSKCIKTTINHFVNKKKRIQIIFWIIIYYKLGLPSWSMIFPISFPIALWGERKQQTLDCRCYCWEFVSTRNKFLERLDEHEWMDPNKFESNILWYGMEYCRNSVSNYVNWNDP